MKQDKPNDGPTVPDRGTGEAERWVRMVLENIDEAFFALDRAWRFAYVNAQAERMLGRRREDLLGKVVWNEYPEAAEMIFGERAQRVMRERVPVEFQAHSEKLGKWLGVRIFPTEEGIASYVRDVTARWNKVQQLRLLQTAVAHLNDMVLITEASPIDAPGPCIVFVNAAFERMTGYTREEVIGKSPRMLQGPRTSREALDRIRQALERAAPVREEIVNYTKDGRELLIEIDIVPILDDEGRCTHFVAIERDMTARRKLEEQLLHAQKMEAIGRLAGGVAHDFNNLLTAIRASADFLREDCGPRAIADIVEIEQACARATDLTRRLLALGRRQVLEQRVLDLNAVVGDMERMLSRVIGEDVALEVSLAPKLGASRVDPAQMQQVILNLAVNARDAMPEGGRLVIRTDNAALDAEAAGVRGLSAGRWVVLSVIDSGVGMDEATRQRAFEPFYTTKEPGRGSGLGLSTVYGIVSQCGGAVDISSAPGKGTAVRVYLPAVEAAPAPAEECGARKGSAVRAPRAGTVLLVEDEEAPRRLLHRALTRMGYAVLEARSGEEALSLWHSKRSEIDAVVSDVVMPGMGGPALVERLRAEAPRLPVVFISGYAQGVLPDPAALGDRVTLLEKPFALAALEERLRAVLEA